MLRMYLLQISFNLSDVGVEAARFFKGARIVPDDGETLPL